GGGHLIRIRPVPTDGRRGRGEVMALTAKFTAEIEAQIRRAPAEWVWWHERWRRQPDGALDERRPARVHGAGALRRGAVRGSSPPRTPRSTRSGTRSSSANPRSPSTSRAATGRP